MTLSDIACYPQKPFFLLLLITIQTHLKNQSKIVPSMICLISFFKCVWDIVHENVEKMFWDVTQKWYVPCEEKVYGTEVKGIRRRTKSILQKRKKKRTQNHKHTHAHTHTQARTHACTHARTNKQTNKQANKQNKAKQSKQTNKQ